MFVNRACILQWLLSRQCGQCGQWLLSSVSMWLLSRQETSMWVFSSSLPTTSFTSLLSWLPIRFTAASPLMVWGFDKYFPLRKSLAVQQEGYMIDSPHHLIEAIKNGKRVSNKPNHYSLVDREGIREPGPREAQLGSPPADCLL